MQQKETDIYVFVRLRTDYFLFQTKLIYWVSLLKSFSFTYNYKILTFMSITGELIFLREICDRFYENFNLKTPNKK